MTPTDERFRSENLFFLIIDLRLKPNFKTVVFKSIIYFIQKLKLFLLAAKHSAFIICNFVVHIAFYRLKRKKRLITHRKRVDAFFAQVVYTDMELERNAYVIIRKAFYKVIVTFLRRHKLVCAESYEMICVKMCRKAVI